MRILLTGVDGYIGSILAPQLVQDGHDVTGLDTGYYREGWLYSDPAVPVIPRVLIRDIRSITLDDLAGLDAVIHLAELSNDPLGEHRPEITFEINHRGSVALAELAKAAGVQRFIYTSSCSVYGVAEGVVDETSPTNPQTAYAECKVLVEQDVSAMASDHFSPVFLRNATAYGASPRMRFDIVLNNLAGWARTTRKIAMTSDGTPWRPLVHVDDICQAIRCVLNSPREATHGEIYNVGNTQSNYQIREVAEIVGDVFPDCEVTFGPPGGDNRSYQVNFAKIESLPGFTCRWDARKGAQQLCDLFHRIDLSREIFEHRAFTRIESLKYLTRTAQLDDAFRWTAL